MVAGAIGSIFLMLFALAFAFASGMCSDTNVNKIAVGKLLIFGALSVVFGALALIVMASVLGK